MSQDSPQIQAIKARYKASLPEKAELLMSLLKPAEVGENLVLLHEELHKFAGSSGMYSYDDISDLCRKAMRSIDQNNIEDLQKELRQLIELVEQQS